MNKRDYNLIGPEALLAEAAGLKSAACSMVQPAILVDMNAAMGPPSARRG